jgi:hypothetical protein
MTFSPKFTNEIIVPALALVATYFWVSRDLRGLHWKREIDAHVGRQIRAALVDMVPKDVKVTAGWRRPLNGAVCDPRQSTDSQWE